MRIPLTLDGDLFLGFKKDIEGSLDGMVGEMVRNNRSDGTLTAKVTVHIENLITPEGALIRKPVFHFKTTINIPVKGSLEGAIKAPLCFQRNELTGEYELIPISGTLFQEED